MEKINNLLDGLKRDIIGQDNEILEFIIWFLSWGNVLLEWVPGLWKTKLVKTFSSICNLNFKRIQATPDLLPSDLIGMNIYNPDNKKFELKKWPIFSNLVLVDEINRAPAKLQSALLEAMEEKQVTIWDETFVLDNPFMIIATQNPIEQSWTYELPEAQLDRFLLKIILKYPSKSKEFDIYKANIEDKILKITKKINKTEIEEFKKLINLVHVSDEIFNYVANLADYTRNYKSITKFLEYWISTRAWIDLIKVAKTHAFISWRDYVIPEDIKKLIFPVLRHRLILNYDSQIDNLSSDDIIKKILDNVKFK